MCENWCRNPGTALPSLAPRRPSVRGADSELQSGWFFKVLRGMFGSGLSLQLEGAMEAFVIVFAALILFLIVKAGQGVLEEVQDSMSETERGKRLGAQRKKGIPKKKGPSTDPGSKEVREWGKDAPGEKREERGKEAPKKKSCYPVK